MKEMTFEEVNQHVESVKIETLDASAMTTLEVNDFLKLICENYQKVRPILLLISQTPFLPKKWRDVVSGFVNALDLLCPQ